MRKNIKRYSELILLPTFEERFQYLKIGGKVGQDTFGYFRWLNQRLYQSTEFRKLKRDIVIRDLGCDLGLAGFEIHDKIILHHMNPITEEDIVSGSEFVWNPEYLICVSDQTHRAIHYGTDPQFTRNFASRSANDTCPWK